MEIWNITKHLVFGIGAFAMLGACVPTTASETVTETNASNAVAASCAQPANAAAKLASTGALVEGERRSAGLGSISRNAQLDQAAQDFACWVGQKGYNPSAPHTGAGGSTPMTRVKQIGYRSCLTAENLGYNQASPEQVVQVWMNSPGHRANILRNGVRHYGLGLAQHGSSPVWILVLAKPC